MLASTFRRPVVAARGGGRGGRGGATGDDVSPIQQIWSLIGMNPPAVGGRGGGGGGGGRWRCGASMANTGDYLVTMIVNGQTYKQTFRVERVSGGAMSGSRSGKDENHDRMGSYTPQPANKQK